MKTTTAILITMLLCNYSLWAQAPMFEWVSQAGSNSGYDSGNAIATDNAGNVYITGPFTDTCDFDPGPGVFDLVAFGQTDIFVAKLDAIGNLVWAKQIGGEDVDFSRSIAVDEEGNVYITGNYQGTVDFDPGPGLYTLSTSGLYRVMFIVKLDAFGNLGWALDIEGMNGATTGSSIEIGNSGDLILSGVFHGTVDFDPGTAIDTLVGTGLTEGSFFVCKFNIDGAYVWAKQLGNIDYLHEAVHAITDNQNNIYITGFHKGGDFDPGPDVFIFQNTWEVFVCKLDVNGGFIWAKSTENFGSGYAKIGQGNSIAVDHNGNIYVTGDIYNYELIDFDPGQDTFALTSSGVHDAFIWKLDAAGDFVWAKKIGGSSNDYGTVGWAISCDGEGNTYSTGSFNGDVDFDPGSAMFELSAGGFTDAYILKLNKEGELVWAGKLGQSSFTQGKSIFLDTYNNIYTTGSFSGISDFDPGPFWSFYTSFGAADVFIHKMSQCQAPVSIQSEEGLSLCFGDSIQLNAVLPNAFTPLSYSWNTTDSTEIIVVAPDSSSTYTVSVNYEPDCFSSDTINLEVHSLPEAYIAGDLDICEEEYTELIAEGGETYLWSDNNNHNTIEVSPFQTTAYTVTVTNVNGCTDTDSVTVTVYPLPVPEISGESEQCPGDTLFLSANGGINYLWNTGNDSDVLTEVFYSNSMYIVTVTDAKNCTATEAIMIVADEQYCPPCAIVPNAFTPDADGVNDVFRVLPGEGIEVLDFRIYNRWGNLVHNKVQPWDGRYKGETQPSDVYLYIIRVQTHCGMQELKGEVTLIR